MKRKLCLTIGCGTKPEKSNALEEWINTDKYPDKGNYKLDLDVFPYDFEDNKFDVIKMHSVLEHINHYDNVINELKRISKDGVEWRIRVPYPFASGNDNEFHKRRFRYNSFEPPKTDREQAVLYKGIKIIDRHMTFDTTPVIGKIIGLFANTFPRIYNNTFLRFLFPAHHIFFTLKVNKTLKKAKELN